KLGRVPGEIRAEPPTRLPIQVVGKLGILHADIVSSNASDPAFFESPEHLGINPPIVKRFSDRKRIIRDMAGFESAIHEFGLPFHKWETAFGTRAFPFVE